MAAITVRRKPKIGFRPGAPDEGAAGGEAPAAVVEQQAAQAPVLSKFDASQVDGSSYTVAGICGLAAMFILIGLLVCQYLENDYYKDAFGAGGLYVPSSAPTPTASAPASKASAPEAAPAVSEQPAEPAAAPAESTPAAGGGNTRSKVEDRNAAISGEIGK
jgi:hypothetical protein